MRRKIEKYNFDEFKDRRFADWRRVRLAIEHENTLIHHRITWLLTSQGFIIAVLGAVFNEAQKTQGLNLQHAGLLTFLLSLVSVLICRAIAKSLGEADIHLENLDKWWYRYWNKNVDWDTIERRSSLVEMSLEHHPEIQRLRERKQWDKRLSGFPQLRVNFAIVANVLQCIWTVVALWSIYLFSEPWLNSIAQQSSYSDNRLLRSSHLQRKIRVAAGISASYKGKGRGGILGFRMVSPQYHNSILEISKMETNPCPDLGSQENVHRHLDLVKDENEFSIQLAHSLNDLAATEGDAKRWDSALALGLEALSVIWFLPDDHAGKESIRAPLTNNLGVFYSELGEGEKSRNCFLRSVGHFRKLAYQNPLYTKDLNRVQENLRMTYYFDKQLAPKALD